MQASVSEPLPAVALKAVKVFFEDNMQGNAPILMSYIRQFYGIPEKCSLNMKILVLYLRQLDFLEHRAYNCRNGKRLDVFARKRATVFSEINEIYQAALMIAETSQHLQTDIIMKEAIRHVQYKQMRMMSL